MVRDTIYAPATARGKAGIAVVRISGPAAGSALMALSGRAMPAPRRAVLRDLRHPGTGELVDQGLVLWFPAPGSFTGEDMAEIHGHGGIAAMDGVLSALGAVPGLRMAEAGEFSRRAFDNGKLDLTQIEGIADLVGAETAAQRRQALRQLDGAMGALYGDWSGRILRVLAHLEALIDFPDEDLPGEILTEIGQAVSEVATALDRHLAEAPKGERIREGVRIAIIGAPNVGKSSLLNALLGRQAAIVSEREGTTRDILEHHLDIGGWPVVVADTAGLRRSDDPIELEGVRRAEAWAEAADIRLLMDSVDLPGRWQAVGPHDLRIRNKADLGGEGKDDKRDGGSGVVSISVRTGSGIAEVLAALETRIAELMPVEGAAVPTRLRHREALEEASGALGRVSLEGDPVLAAEDLRQAVRALGRITGTVDVEDILDIIFRDFCIGK